MPQNTTFATATDTSRDDAFLREGARAVMAVTPQMLVPAAMREPWLRGRPKREDTLGIKRRPALTVQSTTGRVVREVERIEGRDNLAPTQTIPRRKIVVLQYFKPGENTDLSFMMFGRALFSAIPSMIDTGTPEIGDAAATWWEEEVTASTLIWEASSAAPI